MLHHGARYAVFVWSAYGLSGLVVGAVVVQSLLSARRWRRRAEAATASDRPGRSGP